MFKLQSSDNSPNLGEALNSTNHPQSSNDDTDIPQPLSPPLFLKTISWNIEGFRRNKTNLKHFLTLDAADIIFLSEPNLYQCDVLQAMQLFRGDYFCSLNSSDLYDPELPLVKSTAHGGTMILWKQSLDPYISVVTVDSSAFLPIILAPPSHQLSIHLAIYLPTQGKEKDFIEDLAKLSACIEQLRDQHPDALFYLRGDFNVNNKNKRRMSMLNYLCTEQILHCIPIDHCTTFTSKEMETQIAILIRFSILLILLCPRKSSRSFASLIILLLNHIMT